MSVYIHGFLNPTLGKQDGTQITEGTGLNPLYGVVQAGQVSDPIRFGIRMVPDVVQSILQITDIADVNADYTFSTSNSIYSAFQVFNNTTLLTSDVSGIGFDATTFIKIHKNTGSSLTVVGYIIRGHANSTTYPLTNWTVKDSSSTVIDTQSGITGWISGVDKTFILSTPVTTNELSFCSSGTKVLSKIQLILAGEAVPMINTVSVAGNGTNADKWAFTKANIIDITNTAIVSSGGSANPTASLTDGTGLTSTAYQAVLGNSNAFVTLTLTKATLISKIIVTSIINNIGVVIKLDEVVIDTVAQNTNTFSTWVITPGIKATAITLASPSGWGEFTGIAIYTEAVPLSTDYTDYGNPLVITNTSNITALSTCNKGASIMDGNLVTSVPQGLYSNGVYYPATFTFTAVQTISALNVYFLSTNDLTIPGALTVTVDGILKYTEPVNVTAVGNRTIILPSALTGTVITLGYLPSTPTSFGYWITEVEILTPISALDTTNTIIYAKRKALTSEANGLDTTVKLQITCT